MVNIQLKDFTGIAVAKQGPASTMILLIYFLNEKTPYPLKESELNALIYVFVTMKRVYSAKEWLREQGYLTRPKKTYKNKLTEKGRVRARQHVQTIQEIQPIIQYYQNKMDSITS